MSEQKARQDCVEAQNEFAKRHLKDSQTIRNKMWCLWPECQASHLEETWHHPYGEAWSLQHHSVGMFFSARTGRLVRIEGKMNGAKYREILELQNTQDLRLG